MRVAVVGGGAVGLTAALELGERGESVVCFERDRLGSGSTGRAAGICYDAFADDVDAEVADRALDRYREWDLLQSVPYVWIARTESDATAIRGQLDGMRANGREVERIAPATLGERYPALETDSIVTAGLARAAGVVDPTAVVEFLADRARTAGVRLEPGTPVSLRSPRTVVTPDGTEEFDAVVVAAGPATKPLVADVGVALALKPYRAQALLTDPVDATLPSFYDATEAFYWRPRNGRLLVGDGTHEVGEDWNRDADEGFVESALARLRGATALDPTVDRAWAGLCTATPDRDPLVGEVRDGLWVATGWQGHGLMRAPAVGDFLAAQVRGDDAPFAVPFGARADPTRFDGTEAFDALGDPTRDWP